MKKLAILFLLLCISFHSFSQSGTWQWGVRGGTNVAYSPGYLPQEDIDDITVDKWGNIYIVAQVKNNSIYIGSYGFPNYGSDDDITQVIFASFRCDGTLRWAKAVEGSTNGGGKMFAVKTDTLGGVYFDGYIEGSCDVRNATTVDITVGPGHYPLNISWYLMKTDTAGVFQWIRFPEDTTTIFGTGAWGYDMDVDGAGNVYMPVYLETGAYAGGAFVATYRGWDYQNNVQNYMIQYDHLGNFVTGYHFPYFFSGSGDPRQWYIRDKKRHKNIFCGIDGYYSGDSLVIAGTHIHTMFVAEFDDLGNLVWLTQQDTGLAQAGLIATCDYRPALDANGNIYFGGWVESGYSFDGRVFTNTGGFAGGFVMKLDTNGHVVWTQNSNNTDAVAVAQVAVSGDTVAAFGSVETTYLSWGTDTMNRPWNCGYRTFLALLKASDGSVMKLDSVRTITCGGDVNPSSGGGMIDGGSGCIIADQYGNFYMGGTVDDIAYFGPDSVLSYSGDLNFFVAKYGTANCTILPATLSVKETSAKTISIYPNPARDEVVIDGATVGDQFAMLDIMGRTVLTSTISATLQHVNTSQLHTGLYFIEITGSDGNKTVRKLMIQQ